MRCPTLILITVFTLAGATRVAAGAPALEQVAKRFEGGDYRGALREIAKVMATSDAAANDKRFFTQ